MFRNLQTILRTKGFIIAAILFSFFTLYANIAPAQQRPDDENSMKYPRNWHNNDWVKFVSSTVSIVAGEAYGVAGASVNPVYAGKIPLVDIYSAISAMADSTKAGLQLWLQRKMADAETAEDWKNADRYEQFLVCLTHGECGGMRALIKTAASKANGGKTVILTVEVREAETNKALYEAEVRVRSISTGTEVWAALTNNDGATDKLDMPAEKAAQGLQVRVKANNYEEKWSDITPDLLTGGERRFTVYLSRALDPRFIGTWNCTCNYGFELRKDGTGVFRDRRNGPVGSLSQSGVFEGTWKSAGDRGELYLPQDKNGYRWGTFILTLKDGKLSDQFGGVFTK